MHLAYPTSVNTRATHRDNGREFVPIDEDEIVSPNTRAQRAARGAATAALPNVLTGDVAAFQIEGVQVPQNAAAANDLRPPYAPEPDNLDALLQYQRRQAERAEQVLRDPSMQWLQMVAGMANMRLDVMSLNHAGMGSIDGPRGVDPAGFVAGHGPTGITTTGGTDAVYPRVADEGTADDAYRRRLEAARAWTERTSFDGVVRLNPVIYAAYRTSLTRIRSRYSPRFDSTSDSAFVTSPRVCELFAEYVAARIKHNNYTAPHRQMLQITIRHITAELRSSMSAFQHVYPVGEDGLVLQYLPPASAASPAATRSGSQRLASLIPAPGGII